MPQLEQPLFELRYAYLGLNDQERCASERCILLVMDLLLQGLGLKQKIRRSARMPSREAIRVSSQMSALVAEPKSDWYTAYIPKHTSLIAGNKGTTVQAYGAFAGFAPPLGP
jgi:hypothetical protein